MIETCEAAARDWPKYKVIHVITSTDEHGNMYHHPLIGPPELITYTDAEIEAMRQDERNIKNYLRRLAGRQRKPTKHAA